MYHFRRITAFVLLAALLALAAVPGLAASVGVTLNSAVRFYRSPSTASDSVKVAKGTAMTLTGMSSGWGKVKYKGVTGYIPLKYLNSTTRYPAYVNRSAYIYASASLSAASRPIKANTRVYVIGKADGFYRIQNADGTVTCYIPASCLSANPTSQSSPSGGSAASGTDAGTSWKSRVVRMNWFNGGSAVLPVGSYGYLYDIKTGTVVHIKRMGGVNHADCEPASASDTAKLKKIAGGTFSWDSHAVILYAGGKFVACAINTMPHGSQTLTSNGYNGQFCLHMTGSRTHGTDKQNEAHQASIDAAYNWAH